MMAEVILMVWIALGCAFLGCGAMYLAAKIPRQRSGRTSDTWRSNVPTGRGAPRG
jgi:hypothetical protein